MAQQTKKPKTEFQRKFEKLEWEHHLGEIPEDTEKNSALCVFGDGFYLVRKNKIGTFRRLLTPGSVPGMDDGPGAGFEFALPKIPVEILQQQVEFYRAVMERWNNAEAYSIVFYDLEKEEYFLMVPKQKMSKASVHYSNEELLDLYPSSRYIQVISAHSHNDMKAYFSGVDNRDEQGDMLYMVMGTLNKNPTYALRANLAGKECLEMSLDKIFEMDDTEWCIEAPAWKAKYVSPWMDQLNVEADYTSPHASHNIKVASALVTKTYDWDDGLSSYWTGKKWPTETPLRQMSFWDDSAPQDIDHTNASEEYVLKQVAVQMYQDAAYLPGDQTIRSLLENLFEAGYEDDIQDTLERLSETPQCELTEEFQAWWEMTKGR